MQNNIEELTNLTSSELLHKSDELRGWVIKKGQEHAEANQKYKDIKELMPSILAQFQDYYATKVMGIKPAMVKIKAQADPQYMAKIKEMNQLEYEANMKEIEYKAWYASLKNIESISYVRNNELKLAR